MGGQSVVYVHNIDVLFHLLRLFTRDGWVVKKGQNSDYVVIEWPLTRYQGKVRDADPR